MAHNRWPGRISVALSILAGIWLVWQWKPEARVLKKPVEKTQKADSKPETIAKPPLPRQASRQAAILLPPPPAPAAPKDLRPETKKKPSFRLFKTLAVLLTPDDAPPPSDVKPLVPSSRPPPVQPAKGVQPLKYKQSKKKPPPPPRKKPLRASKKPPVPAKPGKVAKLVEAKPTPPGDAVVQPGKKLSREGRVILRLLEHGDGPDVEIALPDNDLLRSKLLARLSTCYGMRIMLMDQAGGLFINQGRKGVKWAINLDKYSGFVRQIVGGLSRSEQNRIGQIRKYHGGLAKARPVRIFPRRVDARLLGGLSHLIGKPYRGLKVVRANYELRGGQVAIVNLSADGRRKSGRILLDPVARSCPVPRSVNNDP